MQCIFKVGLLHDNDENCLLVRGRAFCSNVVLGGEMVLDPVTGIYTIRLVMLEMSSYYFISRTASLALRKERYMYKY